MSRASNVPGETRSELLARVRVALATTAGSRRTPEPPASPAEVDAAARLAHAGVDLISMFVERAISTGMHAVRATTASAPNDLDTLLGTLGAKRVNVGVRDGSLAWVDRVAADHGRVVVDHRSGVGIDALYDVDVGVTDVEAALAETGTLVVVPGGPQSRGAFLTPPIHVALAPASRIVPDLLDVWARIIPANGASGRPPAALVPTSLTMITGPSKTADIEGVLITGVHGPKAVHIIVIEDA